MVVWTEAVWNSGRTNYAFTPSGTGWQNYDIYTNLGVPKGAIAHIVCASVNDAAARTVGVRTDGSSLSRYIKLHEGEAGGAVCTSMHVKVDSSTGYIETYCDSTTGVTFYLTGYWTGVDYTETNDVFLPTAATTWTTITTTAAQGARVHEIALINYADAAAYTMGVRAVGSSLTRTIAIHEAESASVEYTDATTYTFCVKTDSSSQYQYYTSATTYASIKELGYFSTAMDYVEKMATLNCTATGWSTFDISANLDRDLRVADILIGNGATGVEYDFGSRVNGSSAYRYILVHESETNGNNGFTLPTGTDSSGNLQIYAGATSEVCRILGYYEHASTYDVTKTSDARLKKTADAFTKTSDATLVRSATTNNLSKYSDARLKGTLGTTKTSDATLVPPTTTKYVLPSGSDVNIDQTSNNSYEWVSTSETKRVGFRKTFPKCVLKSFGWYGAKYGSPTGSVYLIVRRVSDDVVIYEEVLCQAETLTTSNAWRDYTLENLTVIEGDVRVQVEYPSGNSSNDLKVYYQNTDAISNEVFTKYVGTTYTDSSGYDFTKHLVYNTQMKSDATLQRGTTYTQTKTSDARLKKTQSIGAATNFAYKVAIPANYSSDGAQTDYQMKLTIYPGSGTNSAGVIYLNSHAENWPYDILFENASGDTLPHWRESYDANSQVVWVQTDSIASSGTTDFYLFYGDSGTADGSNGSNTFIFFDHFTSIGAYWTQIGGHNATIVDSTWLKLDSTGTTQSKIISTNYAIAAGQNVSIEMYMNIVDINSDAGGGYHSGFYPNLCDASEVAKDGFAWYKEGSYDRYVRINGSGTVENDGTGLVEGYYIRNTWKYLNDRQIHQTVGTPSINETHSGTTYKNSNNTYLDLVAGDYRYANDVRIDWLFIRNLTLNEPTWATPGSETSNSQPLKADSKLILNPTVTKYSDARLKGTIGITKTSDATLTSGPTTHDLTQYANARLRKTVDAFTKTSDSRLKKTVDTFTKTSDARLKKTVDVFTKTSNARLEKTVDVFTKTSDARLKKTVDVFTKTSDARLKVLGALTSKTSDAKLKLIVTQTKTSDARLKQLAITTTKTSDAKLKLVVTQTKASDARLKVLGATSTKTSDARLKRPDNTQTKTADARLLATVSASKQTDARLKKTVAAFTKTADAKLIRRETQTKTSDARLEKTVDALTKTSDARLKKLWAASTKTSDARLRKTVDAFTKLSDARLKRTDNNLSRTSDAKLIRRETQTKTSDARLEKTADALAKASDARLKKLGITQTKTSDATLRTGGTLTKTSDARLKQQGITTTKTSDGKLKLVVTQTKLSDARLKGTLSTTKTSDGRLKVLGKAVTTTSDARLKTTFATSKTSDARLKKTVAAFTKTADAKLVLVTTQTKTSDARLKGTLSTTKTSDALLERTTTTTKASDARLKKMGLSTTKTADAKLTLVVSQTKTSDARLKVLGKSLSKTADAQLVGGTTLIKYSDAKLKQTGISTTKTADAKLIRTPTITKTADAKLMRRETISKSSDARLKKLAATITKTSDASLRTGGSLTKLSDARLKQTGVSTTKTSDARLVNRPTQTKTSDARLKLVVSLTKPSDARLEGTITVTKYSDARLKTTKSTTKTSDARLSAGGFSAKTSDARLKQTGVSTTKLSDALLKKVSTITKTSDARLVGGGYITKTANALLKKVVTTTVTSDAKLVRTPTVTKTSDARLKGTISIIKTADSFLAGSSTIQVTSDARLKTTVSVTKTSDAKLVHTHSIVKTSDARLKKTQALTLSSNATLFLPVPSLIIPVEGVKSDTTDLQGDKIEESSISGTGGKSTREGDTTHVVRLKGKLVG